jgi:hypothetical protein
MTTFQLVHELRSLTEELKDSAVLEFISSLDRYYPELTDAAVKPDTTQSQQKSTEYLAKVTEVTNRVVLDLKAGKPGNRFVLLDAWIKRVHDIEERLYESGNGQVAKPLTQSAQLFFQAYDDSVQSYGGLQARYLVIAAHELKSTLLTASSLTESIERSLMPTVELDDKHETLSLLLHSTTSFRTVIVRLSSLLEMYDELCRLLDVSTTEYPLQIVKLESGSLWLQLFGESRVIRLVTEFIEETVSYLHRNFTREGQIQAIPKNAEAVVSLLNLSDRLAESGVATDVLRDNIHQSAIILSKQLTQLLANEPTVDVNEKTYSILPGWEERFLRESRGLFLTNGEETDDKKPDKELPPQKP